MARVRDKLSFSSSYEDDFYGWALEQAALLRARSFDLLDLDNIAEEIESLARGEARELRSRYGTLLTHLLKWQFQPERRSYSWLGTIRRERVEIDKHLRDNPGLKPRRSALFADSYDGARLQAVADTALPPEHFPETCPYTLEQATDPTFWPGGAAMPPRPARGRRR
jgi:hypothetical protein